MARASSPPAADPANAARRYAAWLLLALALLMAAAAIRPVDPHIWALENLLVVFVCGYLVLNARSFVLSRVSYTLIFVFMALHQLGAHYTYVEVPYERWWAQLSGASLHEQFGWQRNHYDRLVHFAYGLLIVYPLREAMLRIAAVRGAWGYLLPLALIMATSLLYEMIEWAAAVALGEASVSAYLGAQGDPWDAHWDMLWASVGGLICLAAIFITNALLQRDFARDWAESVRVKQRQPLGETELARMLQEERTEKSGTCAH